MSPGVQHFLGPAARRRGSQLAGVSHRPPARLMDHWWAIGGLLVKYRWITGGNLVNRR